jgi:hypothetical protein
MRSQFHTLRAQPESFTTRNERGAVLAISLVFLTIMTLLAISSLRTATLQLVTVGNAQHREQAFQLAQTGIAMTISRLNHASLRLVAVKDWSLPNALTGHDEQTGDTYSVDLHFLYRGPSPVHTESEPTEAFYFELTSTGRTGGRNALSIQTQGLWVSGVDDRPVNVSYWFPHESP